MDSIMNHEHAFKEIFVKYVYSWELYEIQLNGIHSSSGLMGVVVYCLKVMDSENRKRVTQGMAMEMDWSRLGETILERTEVEAMNFIYPIFLEYTGPYLYTKVNPETFASNIGLLTPHIDIGKIVIGMPMHFRK